MPAVLMPGPAAFRGFGCIFGSTLIKGMAAVYLPAVWVVPCLMSYKNSYRSVCCASGAFRAAVSAIHKTMAVYKKAIRQRQTGTSKGSCIAANGACSGHWQVDPGRNNAFKLCIYAIYDARANILW